MIDKNYIYAVSIIVGTTIGAGIFGLPYAAMRSGFVPALIMLLLLGVMTTIINLMYAEVTLRTKKEGRMVGYSEKYTGKYGKIIATLITLFSLYANLLVYIIIGGVFLNSIFSNLIGGSEFTYSVIFFVLMTLGVYINLKMVSVIEFAMVVILLAAILGVIFKSVPLVNLGNLMTYNSSEYFYPFGIILFSLGALSAIPELEGIIKKKQKRIKSAIIIGTLIPIIIYSLFMAAVLGATGQSTTEDALKGLYVLMGDGVVFLGNILAIFAIATSYIVIGLDLKNTFKCDYKISENKSWALACFVPFIIFVWGLRNFITVINITGGIAGGLTGILVIILYYQAQTKGDVRPPYEIKVPEAFSILMMFVFILGMIYQFVYQKW